MGKRGGVRQRHLFEDNAANSSGAGTSGAEARTGGSEIGLASRRSVRSRLAGPNVEVDESTLPLYQSLKRDWCKGEISAKKVQEYALGAQLQGALGMSAPARAGSSGKHPENIHRSLLIIFKPPQETPELTWAHIPTKRGNVVHPFMLPHQWFSSLYACQPDLFDSSVRGPEGASDAFWTLMSPTDFVSKHPKLSRDDFASTIPLGFYGDVGAYSLQDSVYIFTWNSLLWGWADNGETLSGYLHQEERPSFGND